jgi:hypothetical protein
LTILTEALEGASQLTSHTPARGRYWIDAAPGSHGRASVVMAGPGELG